MKNIIGRRCNVIFFEIEKTWYRHNSVPFHPLELSSYAVEAQRHSPGRFLIKRYSNQNEFRENRQNSRKIHK